MLKLICPEKYLVDSKVQYREKEIEDGVFNELIEENENTPIFYSDIVCQTLKIELMHEYAKRRRRENYCSENFSSLLELIDALNRLIFEINYSNGGDEEDSSRLVLYISRKITRQYKTYMENKDL